MKSINFLKKRSYIFVMAVLVYLSLFSPFYISADTISVGNEIELK